MELQDQCCNIEQAKQLKKLGIIQDSLFYHTNSEKWGILPKKSIDFTGNPYSAFTVAELGMILPEYVYSKLNSGGGEQWTCMMVENGMVL